MEIKGWENWSRLNKDTRRAIINKAANLAGLPAEACEKDWWVVQTLDVVFQTSIKDVTIFKGGTSLSKGWNLIKRFSEDIDLALDRKHLNFSHAMTKTQVAKLRKASNEYIGYKLFPELQEKFYECGYTDVQLELQNEEAVDQDPRVIVVNYPSLFEVGEGYLRPRVLIEIGSRSMMEPIEVRPIRSIISEINPQDKFVENAISIPTVLPKRTFLEKIFLLHEEFQKKTDAIRVDRLSRHLYDLEKIMDTEHGLDALQDEELYRDIVKHRSSLTAIRGIDYRNHDPRKIAIVPPADIRKQWETDYKRMKEYMITEDAISFKEIISRIEELQNRVRKLSFAIDNIAY